MNSKNKILTLATLGILVAFTFSSNKDSASEVKQLKESSESQLLGYLNKEKLHLLRKTPSKEDSDNTFTLTQLEELKQNGCINQKTTKEIHYSNSVLQDYQYGIKNCELLSYHISKRNISSFELLERTKKLKENYFDLLKKAKQNQDVYYDHDFYDLFINNMDLLSASKKSELYPLISYIMGDSAIKSGDNELYMVGPTILINLILDEKDKTVFTQYAWITLQSEMQFGFTGSSGENIPKDWVALLNKLSALVT